MSDQHTGPAPAFNSYGTHSGRVGVPSRRGEFGLDTMHRTADESEPIVSAIDKVGGNSGEFTGLHPQGFTDYDHDPDNDSNYDRNRYGSNL